MSLSPLLDQLERALRCLPGVGQRTASRMALHLLERNRAGGLHLALALEAAMTQIGECQQGSRGDGPRRGERAPADQIEAG